MTQEHLSYFKALIEGDEKAVGWHLWWPKHCEEFRDLPRTKFLKLKFEKIRFAAQLLDEHGVEYSWSRAGRLAAAHAGHAPELLDDSGLPKPELQRKLFGGAIGAIEDGDLPKARKLLDREIRRIKRLEEVDQAQELGDLQFDGESFLNAGEIAAARVVLEAVVSFGPGSDLTDIPVREARKRLEKLAENPADTPWQPDT